MILKKLQKISSINQKIERNIEIGREINMSNDYEKYLENKIKELENKVKTLETDQKKKVSEQHPETSEKILLNE